LESFGNIIWQFDGADIFVSLDEENSFQLDDNHIVLKDFTGTKYTIDFDGNSLSYNSTNHN